MADYYLLLSIKHCGFIVVTSTVITTYITPPYPLKKRYIFFILKPSV